MRYLPALAIVFLSIPADAGGGINYTATDPAGTRERVVEMRALPDDLRGAMVSYTRTDGTRSLVEYAIRCDPLAYAYLGIANDKADQTPNLLSVRQQSDRRFGNTLRPIAPISLSDDPAESPLRALAEAVCS